MTYLTEADYEAIDNEGGRFDRKSMFATVERIAARVAAETRESVLGEAERRIREQSWATIAAGRFRAKALGVVRDLRGGEDRG